MSWDLKEHDFEHQTGIHYITIHDPAIKAEHHIRIHVTHESCPTCGHVVPKTNTGQIDFRAILIEELSNAEKAHAQGKEYVKKHSIPVRK